MVAQVRVIIGCASWMAHGRGEAGRFLGRIEGIGWLLRKNRIENGSRADPSGSNPHSYGDSFLCLGLFGLVKSL